MKVSIVVGLGFGDEGKGVVTSSLVNGADNPMVIRFNGGHQAGHTVVKNGFRHIFSSFGSGTLHGAPSYWSKYCTVYPTALINEFEVLKNLDPVLYIDPLCPITTPFDVISNQILTKHGSVGVGFGETIRRQENHYTLFAKDLKYKDVLDFKLHNIQNYYDTIGYNEEKQLFLNDINKLLSLKDNIRIQKPDHKGDLIFEGAQGILLDQQFGFFPYVTRSNTTSKNAISLIDKYCQPEIYLVTRAYQTRHGKGPMTNEHLPLSIINNEAETNILNEYQGEFRMSSIDENLLKYAIECEECISDLPKKIVMTCLDQVGEAPNLNLRYPILYNSDPEGNWRNGFAKIVKPFCNRDRRKTIV